MAAARQAVRRSRLRLAETEKDADEAMEKTEEEEEEEKEEEGKEEELEDTKALEDDLVKVSDPSSTTI
jgi:hypothetical protein